MTTPKVKTDFTTLDTTPDVVKNESMQQFPINSPYWVDTRDVFGGTVKKPITVNNYVYENLIAVYYSTEVNGTVGHDICNLNNGIYTWALTNDYELTIGQVMTDIEWGVKHKQLANKRPVLAAGEMNIAKPIVTYNLNSGTYTVPLIKQQNVSNPGLNYEAVLQQKMQIIWNATNCTGLYYPFTNLSSSTELLNNAIVTDQAYVQMAICNSDQKGFIWSSDKAATLCCIINNCNSSYFQTKPYFDGLISLATITFIIVLLMFCYKIYTIYIARKK